jgi:putative PEP-CTERM system histidine kinase
MGAAATDLALYAHFACAALTALLLLRLWRRRAATAGDEASGAGSERGVEPGSPVPMRWFVAALVATMAWAAATAADQGSTRQWTAHAAALADLGRYGAWFGFVIALLGGPRHAPRGLVLGSAVALAGGIAAFAWRAAVGEHTLDASRLALAALLPLPVVGVLAIEQLWRNVTPDARWNAKPICGALACVFGFDLYLLSGGVLLDALDSDALAVRGAVHALGVPLAWLAIGRDGGVFGRLAVSRAAATYSTTLVLSGGYLLLVAAAGYWVRWFGGDWGGALQVALLAAAAVGFAALTFSGSVRARLRVAVAKHFFRYRYDYRQEWLRFTEGLSTAGGAEAVGEQVLRGLADLVESPGGLLWTADEERDAFVASRRWNLPAVADAEPRDSPFSTMLAERQWVIDIAEVRASPRRHEGLVLPAWLLGLPAARLVVPLVAGGVLQGFVVLAEPRGAVAVDWEVRDLLKTAARQAAGHLAQVRATEALLEARKFEAFNRMSAFVVHDLKNIVAQLSLMLKNAQRLHDNREFQQDMLLTVESSLEKMRRLMLQLREGAAPAAGAAGVELAPIVRRLAADASARGRGIECREAPRLATRGLPERLERVLGHLVHNALDATPPSGRVWVHTSREGGQVVVEVGDTGCGMSEAFVQTRLFRPFASTKRGGMGIGSYESREYVRELGGSIEVHSREGEGTLVRVRLPAFELHAPARDDATA